MSEDKTSEPVSKTVITMTVLHPTALDPNVMSDMDVANHLKGGEFIGGRTAVETRPVPAEEVEVEIERMGAPAGFFARPAPLVG